MSILLAGNRIGNYVVQHLIKQNEYTETYKVVNENDRAYFLKVYVMKRTPEKLIDTETREVLEIALLRKIQHQNVVSYISHGIIDSELGECQYVVTNYFTGEVLADKMAREGVFDQEKALGIFMEILNGLKALHNANVCHNDITPGNIMLSNTMNGIPELIDLGHASKACKGTIPFDTVDLDPLYCASANSAGIFDERTDLFSAMAVFYTMLTGKAPWVMDFAPTMPFAQKMLKMKRHRLDNPLEVDGLPVDDKIKYIIGKGLSPSILDGYTSVDQLLSELKGEKAEPSSNPGKTGGQAQSSRSENTEREQSKEEDHTALDIVVKKGNGRGFEDIAGMHELKEMLQKKVIFIIQNKELAQEYKLTPPNGMLLYGPPGCGKTFFAEKFAEQTGFSFILIKSSDLASVYIHGSQEKIGKLFKVAEENAPTVLCFDEFDAFVPNRSAPGSSFVAGEVNEFLSQLNDCSKRGIFVVATTNRPDMIDPAVLRTGRLDKHVYVPMPDHQARKEMFAIYLKGRPCDETIDLDAMADLTDGYIASDIAFIVNDTAMTAAFTHAVITQAILEQTIRDTKPSVSKESLRNYENILARMEDTERINALPRMGYKK